MASIVRQRWPCMSTSSCWDYRCAVLGIECWASCMLRKLARQASPTKDFLQTIKYDFRNIFTYVGKPEHVLGTEPSQLSEEAVTEMLGVHTMMLYSSPWCFYLKKKKRLQTVSLLYMTNLRNNLPARRTLETTVLNSNLSQHCVHTENDKARTSGAVWSQAVPSAERDLCILTRRCTGTRGLKTDTKQQLPSAYSS